MTRVKFLLLKYQAKFVADDILMLFSSHKNCLDISCESSAKQTIHIKCKELFSMKTKNKYQLLQM